MGHPQKSKYPGLYVFLLPDADRRGKIFHRDHKNQHKIQHTWPVFNTGSGDQHTRIYGGVVRNDLYLSREN